MERGRRFGGCTTAPASRLRRRGLVENAVDDVRQVRLDKEPESGKVSGQLTDVAAIRLSSFQQNLFCRRVAWRRLSVAGNDYCTESLKVLSLRS